MTEKEEEKDFTTLLVKWYLEQKKATKDPTASDRGDDNVRREI